MMLKLGFTMEELMFPENYQYSLLLNIESNYFRDKHFKMSPMYEYQELIAIDEGDTDDDDWFTIRQLNPEMSVNYNLKMTIKNDPTLQIFNTFSNNNHLEQVRSIAEFNSNSHTLRLQNLSSQSTDDENHTSLSSSDTMTMNYSTPLPCDPRPLTRKTVVIQQPKQQQSNRYTMSKSMSSLSFCTQSSTSMTSNSTDDISSNSNDANEFTTLHHSNERVHQISNHHGHNRSISDDALNLCNRNRRKRTIFSPADIEHLKEAFIQNPKPSQQDIAILSEKLGHDAYVIRVWFYNKRQATKKRNG